jgi:adenylosuccinate lyase
VKEIESTTNHDVKAVEYYLKEKFEKIEGLAEMKEFLHFTCTSEDINNLAYAMMINAAMKEVMVPKLDDLINLLNSMGQENAGVGMLARTHGQSATPTTVGKEVANFVYRLGRQMKVLKKLKPLGKFNGAVGNFNAHVVVLPDIEWDVVSQEFVESLGIDYNPFSTQIESHDCIAEISRTFSLINTILIDFSRDMWGYCSFGYFKLKAVKGEVGSSTMPHKINPIMFENAEGNLGMGNAMFEHFASKLPISRF